MKQSFFCLICRDPSRTVLKLKIFWIFHSIEVRLFFYTRIKLQIFFIIFTNVYWLDQPTKWILKTVSVHVIHHNSKYNAPCQNKWFLTYFIINFFKMLSKLQIWWYFIAIVFWKQFNEFHNDNNVVSQCLLLLLHTHFNFHPQ